MKIDSIRRFDHQTLVQLEEENDKESVVEDDDTFIAR